MPSDGLNDDLEIARSQAQWAARCSDAERPQRLRKLAAGARACCGVRTRISASASAPPIFADACRTRLGALRGAGCESCARTASWRARTTGARECRATLETAAHGRAAVEALTDNMLALILCTTRPTAMADGTKAGGEKGEAKRAVSGRNTERDRSQMRRHYQAMLKGVSWSGPLQGLRDWVWRHADGVGVQSRARTRTPHGSGLRAQAQARWRFAC